MNNPQSSNEFDKYQVICELGRHPEDIYINYLAEDNSTKEVVILTKFSQFQSKTKQENIDYQALLVLLQSLEHEGIPPYLDCFESNDDFYLVQKYPETKPLSIIKKWTLAQIKEITISILDIFTYLQEQHPAISHNQICPSNLLIDSNFQVYLINFGFAQIANYDLPFYDAMNRNKGFIAPEKKRGKTLTKNSDLYSLGVTLLCLIKEKEANKISKLVGIDGGFNVQGLMSNQMNLTWIKWLENLVAINPQHRYEDAITALNFIQNIEIIRYPEVNFIPDYLELKSQNYGETLIQNITITNPITDTILEGQWEIVPSTYDTSINGLNSWIDISPLEFSSNKINCEIRINTSKLKVGKVYQRQLIIKANTFQENHFLPLRIKTSPIKMKNLIYTSLIMLLCTALVCGWLSGKMVGFTPSITNWLALASGLKIGSFGGYGASFAKINLFVKSVAIMTSITVLGSFLGLGVDVDLIMGFIAGLVVSCTAGIVIKFYVEKNCPRKMAIAIACLTSILGISLGIDLSLSMGNSLLLWLILISGLPLIFLLVKPYWQYQKLLTSYNQQQRFLINS